jgi:5-methylcytosine-specific restriction endonuclease McrA
MALESNGQHSHPCVGRLCLRPAIPEITLAAEYLDAAISAHMAGDAEKAADLIRAANIPAIRDWVESLWGKASPYLQFRIVLDAPLTQSRAERVALRMPNSEEKRLLLARDGHHCRFCGIPVIRLEIRNRLRKLYPKALPWPTDSNETQHPAFQAMWVQYDHVLPHARGGTNALGNMVITCAPCNFARMNYTLEEVGLADPRLREPIRSSWDGLERLLSKPPRNGQRQK